MADDHDHDHDEHEHGDHEHGDHEHDPEPLDPEPLDPAAKETFDAMLDAIRQAKVAQLIVSSVSTFASVAYGKLEAKDLAEAKLAIDAIDALLPFLHGQVDDAMRRDFEQALTNLKVAYANAVASAE